MEDVRRMLNAGADKVSLNTAAVNGPSLVSQGADQFGNQCIVVAIDAKRVTGPTGRKGRSRRTCPSTTTPVGRSIPTEAGLPRDWTR